MKCPFKETMRNKWNKMGGQFKTDGEETYEMIKNNGKFN